MIGVAFTVEVSQVLLICVVASVGAGDAVANAEAAGRAGVIALGLADTAEVASGDCAFPGCCHALGAASKLFNCSMTVRGKKSVWVLEITAITLFAGLSPLRVVDTLSFVRV